MVEMQRSECGILPNGDEVLALTDAAGTQIAITGPETHLLSEAIQSHELAEMMGAFIVAAGTPDIYDGWMNLRTASVGEQLMRVFCGM